MATENNGAKKKSGDNGKRNIFILACAIAIVAVACIIVLIVSKGGGKKGSFNVITGAHDYEKDGYIKLGDYKGITVDVGVTPEDIEDEVNFILEDQELYEHLDGKPESGQMVNISFDASADGEEIEDYSDKNVFIVVGDEEYYEEFDTALLEMAAGESRNVDVKFEDDYGDELVDGKTVSFNLTLNYVCGNQIKQELTDEFVTEYSEGKCTSAENFDNYIREVLYQDNVDSITDTAWETVLENVEVSKENEEETERAVSEEQSRYESMFELTGQDMYEMFGMTEDDLKEIGSEVALQRMAAKTIAAKENISMDDSSYEELLRDYLTEDDTAPESGTLEELEKTYEEEYKENPREAMFLEYVKKYIADNADVVGMES